MGSSVAGAGRTAGSGIATVARSLSTGFVSLGKSILISGTSAALEMQRVSRMFMLGASGQILPGSTPVARAVKLGMGFRRFAPGMLAGGAVVAGSQLLGKSVGGDTGQQISGLGSVLGSGLAGASTGAMIGSAIPVIGTGIGAAIGAVIGTIIPLMDKGTREGVRKFVDGIRKWFVDMFLNITTWFSESSASLQKSASDTIKSLGNAIITIVNGIVSTLQAFPKLIMSAVNFMYERLPDQIKENSTVKNAVKLGNTVANYQIPITRYSGKNVYGMAMDMEQKMSGNRPMIVNDSEFVIPKGGMPVLTDAVARKLNSRSSTNAGSIQVQVNLSLTTHSFVANPDELSKALKEPVYQIISDAWVEATNANRTHRSRTN